MATTKVYVCRLEESREEVDVDSGEEPTFITYQIQDRLDETRTREIAVCPECFELIVCIVNDVLNKREEHAKGKEKR